MRREANISFDMPLPPHRVCNHPKGGRKMNHHLQRKRQQKFRSTYKGIDNGEYHWTNGVICHLVKHCFKCGLQVIVIFSQHFDIPAQLEKFTIISQYVSLSSFDLTSRSETSPYIFGELYKPRFRGRFSQGAISRQAQSSETKISAYGKKGWLYITRTGKRIKLKNTLKPYCYEKINTKFASDYHSPCYGHRGQTCSFMMPDKAAYAVPSMAESEKWQSNTKRAMGGKRSPDILKAFTRRCVWDLL